MGLINRNRSISNISDVGGNKRTHNAYEDMEGLLLNLGVVAALILSFVVGTFATIPQEEIYGGDFRDAFIFDHAFVSYVYESLQLQDFNFTVVGPSSHPNHAEYINLHDIFTVALAEDERMELYQCNARLYLHTSECSEWLRKMEMMYNILLDYFPASSFYAYYSRMPNGRVLSANLYNCFGMASAALSGALLISVIFYVILTVTPIREAANAENMTLLHYFNRKTLSLVIFGFFLLCLGMVAFYYGLAWLVYLRAPLHRYATSFGVLYMYILLVPFTVLIILWAVFVAYRIYKIHTQQVAMQCAGDKNDDAASSTKNKDDTKLPQQSERMLVSSIAAPDIATVAKDETAVTPL